MRNRTLSRTNLLSQIGNTAILRHKGVEDFDARGVAKHLEQIGQIVEQLFIGHHVDSFIGSIAAAATSAFDF